MTTNNSQLVYACFHVLDKRTRVNYRVAWLATNTVATNGSR